MTPAEMANSANYAAMNYGELLNTKTAYSWAIGFQIEPRLKTRRREEMVKITQAYVTAMNGYDATREEILSCLENVGMKETHMFSSHHDVDDQTSSVREYARQDNGKSPLALPEPVSTMGNQDKDAEQETLDSDTPEKDDAAEDDSAASSPEGDSHLVVYGEADEGCDQTETGSDNNVDTNAIKEQNTGETITSEKEEYSFVEKVIEMTETFPVPENINVNTPYYVERSYKMGENGTLEGSRARGRNMSTNDLEALRSASETYVKLFKKKDVVVSNENSLVYYDHKNSIVVRHYHFPERLKDGEGTPVSHSDMNCLSENETYDIKQTLRRLNNAIKQANEYSTSIGTDLNSPCYDEYIFADHGTSKPELKKGPLRFKEEVATLTEIMEAFETFARLEYEGAVVLSKAKCIAALIGNSIYLLRFNIPQKKNYRTSIQEGKRNAPDESEPDLSVTSNPKERDLILNAVEMTRERPVGSSIDVNKPYSVQQNFIITNSGGLFRDGKAFSTNLSVEMIDKNKTLHKKFARTMKASALVSTDDYTAYIWDEGKKLSVFYYNSKNKATSAA